MESPAFPLETERSLVEHMNEFYADANLRYAKAYGHLWQATEARMVALDKAGMELEATVPDGARRIRIPFDHRLHQLVLNPPGGIGRDPQSPAQLDVGQPFLALGEQMHGAEPHPHRQLGALQDGAGDQRCLMTALPALQQLTPTDLTIL